MRGFGEAASSRWEEAIPFLERFLKYNPGAGPGRGILAICCAEVGRVQEARANLDQFTKGWPPAMKNVRFIMTRLPFKDLGVSERFAEGYIKAGLEGEPFGFYKVLAENRLTGEEIRKLFFGRKVTGVSLETGKQWSIDRTQEGNATIRDGNDADTGKSWIEGNMLCNQWDHLYENLKDCWVVYRNPDGTPEKNDEFFGAPGYGLYPFSRIK